jgi:hypothetical protein
MIEKYPIQLFGQVFRLPSENSENKRFPPGKIFRIDARFTSNFGAAYIVLFNYSPQLIKDKACYKVRLCFPRWQLDEVEKLSHNSEVILMDGYKVFAVCRNISVNKDGIGGMEDSWDDL